MPRTRTETEPFAPILSLLAIVSDLHLRPSSLQIKPGFTSKLPSCKAIVTKPFMRKSCSRKINTDFQSAYACKSGGTSSNVAQIVSFEIQRAINKINPGTTPKNMMMNSQSSQRMIFRFLTERQRARNPTGGCGRRDGGWGSCYGCRGRQGG